MAQVIFDAVLMSRMQAIWGGNSGVTMLSRRLGGIPFHDLARMPPLSDPATWRGDPLAAPVFAEVSSAMKAHAYVKVITCGRSCDLDRPAPGPDHPGPPLAAGQQVPGHLVQVCVLTRLGQLEAAETEARRLLATPLSPALPPEMGYAFLTEGQHYFPLRLTAPLSEASLKATRPCSFWPRCGSAVRSMQPGQVPKPRWHDWAPGPSPRTFAR